MKTLLITGGATRNVGKTSFIEQILRNKSGKNEIISLKIKTIYEGDDFFHGKDKNPLKTGENYRITEISDTGKKEDTDRMLAAGAKKVFKIKTKADYLKDAFSDFLQLIGKNNLIICESNSLRDIIKPGVFLFLKLENSNEMKPSAERLHKFADEIILSDGQKHFFDFDRLKIKDNSWYLTK